MKINEAILVLGALAQDTRMRVFRLLVQHGRDGLPAGRIADSLAVNGTTLSRHLAQMEQVGLLMSRREARLVIYTPNFAAMDELMAFLLADCCAQETPAHGGDKDEVVGRGSDAQNAAPCCDS
ncbi:ArsR/SmtB family transcription factor [Kordiimonas sp.]|uniref:ArsR/SmtB family transcription factor n=1 Tax=Kordiimonas sp. TaxID=1970157 RepID=UPI003A8DEB28